MGYRSTVSIVAQIFCAVLVVTLMVYEIVINSQGNINFHKSKWQAHQETPLTNSNNVNCNVSWILSNDSHKFPILQLWSEHTKLGTLDWFFQNNISKISVFGDSHGVRWVHAIEKYIIDICQGNCHSKTAKREGGRRSPIQKYYNDNHIAIHTRECSGCQNFVVKLTNTQQTILLEYLSQEFVADTELQRLLSHWDDNGDVVTYLNQIALSTQEYYLSQYFKQFGFPDIMFLFATYMHDTTFFTAEQFKIHFQHYLDWVLFYSPKHTKLYWISCLSFRNGERDQIIMQFNHIATQQILQLTSNRIQIIPFDLFKISKDLVKLTGTKFSKDNAHFQQVFYDVLMRNILQWIQLHY